MMLLAQQFTDERHERPGRAADDYVLTTPSKTAIAKKFDLLAFTGAMTGLVHVFAAATKSHARAVDLIILPAPIWNFVQAVEGMGSLCEDWNGYGSEPPSNWARELAKSVLFTATSVMVPDSVTPSAQGGVGICFYRGDRYADIECFNAGEILATISDGSGRPEIWEVKPAEIRSALNKISDYINA